MSKKPPKSPGGGSSSTTDSMDNFLDLLSKATIKKDEEDNYKSLKIPQFSDGTEWEAVVFELEINLDKCLPGQGSAGALPHYRLVVL